MNEYYEKVKDFQHRFGTPVAERPQFMPTERALKRYVWMKEEIDEFLEAGDIYEQADAMIDLIYFAIGTMVEIGVRPQEIFDIVHMANMSKLWKDGKPHYKPDGKVMKSPDWVDPKPLVKDAIDRM